ncbi:MAG: toll/interleukin-1 receptor domain-containing protein, partial [Anaerolineae bacterium]
MGHIFISFHHEDAAYAQTIREQLEALEYDVWMYTERLMAGTSWRVAIDEGIQNCVAQIVIFSEHSRESEYVTYEWSYALGLERAVIPVVVGGWDGIHPRLENQTPLDFNDSHFFDMLVGRIVREQARAVQNIGFDPRNVPATSAISGDHYYVSFHTRDARFVADMERRLADHLGLEAINLQKEYVGVSSWSPWHQNKDLAIRQSVALLLVLTPQARREPYNIYEWALALGVRKPVIPILLKPTPLHPRLEELQYLNFIQQKQWDTLYRDLAHAAGRRVVGERPTEPNRKKGDTGPLPRRERGPVLRERITEPFGLFMYKGPETGMSVNISRDNL